MSVALRIAFAPDMAALKPCAYFSGQGLPMGMVSLQHAKQGLSKLIASVEKGETFVITRRGKPVARIVPYAQDKTADPEWLAAYRRMMARLKQGARLRRLRVDRDELHDR